MQEGVRTGSVTHAARTVGGGAGLHFTAVERQSPHRFPQRMDAAGWNVTEPAARLGCERGTLSRPLNCSAGVSANMALALVDIGWGTAEHWM